MELLSHYPLVRYVVEVMFMITLTVFVLGVLVSTWSVFARHFSSGERHRRWKRPEEFGAGCWKLPK
jgi:hypothetical protein